jgi:hypothetical protein
LPCDLDDSTDRVKGARGKGLRTVMIEPADSGHEEFDEVLLAPPTLMYHHCHYS